VNFSDPFGLSPVWLDGIPCLDPIGAPMRPANATTSSGVAGSECGWTRGSDDGSAKFHGGFDWAADVGTDIRAPADATVTYGSGTDSGNFVRFDFGNGAAMTVSHMEAPDGSVRNGQRVTAGTVVGTVGTSGNSAGSGREPHGHVVTRVNGERHNPRSFLSPHGRGGVCR
jgi:murein DD-endopeptidase MepM/ murein hydrolase activator NlpD